MPLRLLYVGDARLARESLGRPGGAIAITEVRPAPGTRLDGLPVDVQPGLECPFDLLFIEHGREGVDALAILQDVVGRAGILPAVIVAEWDEDLAVQALKLGAVDYVARSAVSFRAVYFRLKHLLAHAALMNEHVRLRDAYASSRAEERALRQELERRSAEASGGRSTTEHDMTPTAPEPDAERVVPVEADVQRGQFVRLPVSVCRCSRDGEVTLATHECARLFGYDTPDALIGTRLETFVMESGEPLQRLLDRCFKAGTCECTEIVWRTRDGGRVCAGLMATRSSPTEADLVLHDVTTLRTWEQRLSRSAHYEAAGRYANEMALRCGGLLDRLFREGQLMVPRLDSDAARRQAESLLEGVGRASALLRHLTNVDFGPRPAQAPVELGELLRDLGPVLAHVAGDGVELVMPQLSTPLQLVADPGRVERVLVNIMSCARERVPHGRLTLEASRVDRDASWPSVVSDVRHADYVLLTARFQERPGVDADETRTSGGQSALDDVDMGVLQTLVDECAGHVWMQVEPPGCLILKLHLPCRSDDESVVTPFRPRGWLRRWLGRRS